MNVNTLRGLLPTGNRDLEVDVAHVSRVRNDSNVQVIDCREPDEFASGHIAGSTLMPLGSLSVRLNELKTDRQIVVVCRSGSRSLKAAKVLRAAGFTDTRSMSGGVIAWMKQGHSLESGNAERTWQ